MNSRCLQQECYKTVVYKAGRSTAYCIDHQKPNDYWKRVNAGYGRREKIPGWSRIRSQVISRDKGRCSVCKEKGANEVDHITPLWNGGSNLLTNLQLLCWLCHSIKTELELKEKTKKKFTPTQRGKRES